MAATDGARNYTREQREEALRLYTEHGAPVAAERTGIPKNTISSWAHRAKVKSEAPARTRRAVEVAQLAWDARRASLTNDLGTAAAEILERLRDPAASPMDRQRHAHALAVLVDRAQLLSGGATGRLEFADPEERQQRLREIVNQARDEVAARREQKTA